MVSDVSFLSVVHGSHDAGHKCWGADKGRIWRIPRRALTVLYHHPLTIHWVWVSMRFCADFLPITSQPLVANLDEKLEENHIPTRAAEYHQLHSEPYVAL